MASYTDNTIRAVKSRELAIEKTFTLPKYVSDIPETITDVWLAAKYIITDPDTTGIKYHLTAAVTQYGYLEMSGTTAVRVKLYIPATDLTTVLTSLKYYYEFVLITSTGRRLSAELGTLLFENPTVATFS